MLNKASEIHPHCIGGKNNGCNNEISLISILTMNTFRDWTSTDSLRLVPVSHHLHHLIFLSHIYSESALFQLKPLATVLSLQVLVKKSPSSFIVRPFKYWKVLEGVPGTCSSPAWTTPTLSSCPHRRGALKPTTIFMLPLSAMQQILIFPVLRAPELETVLQVGSHESGVKGEESLTGNTFDAGQDMLCFLPCMASS